MTILMSLANFLTILREENKCRTFRHCQFIETSVAYAFGGQPMYISNGPLKAEPDEITLLAHEIINLVLPKLEMGEQLTLEQMNWVVELAELQLEEAYGETETI
jgi:hypothetical protein